MGLQSVGHHWAQHRHYSVYRPFKASSPARRTGHSSGSCTRCRAQWSCRGAVSPGRSSKALGFPGAPSEGPIMALELPDVLYVALSSYTSSPCPPPTTPLLCFHPGQAEENVPAFPSLVIWLQRILSCIHFFSLWFISIFKSCLGKSFIGFPQALGREYMRSLINLIYFY